MENVIASEGQETRFILKTSGGKPKPSVQWFKDEIEILITSEGIFETIETEETLELVIKIVSTEHAGGYHVELSNDAGTISSNKATLIINSKFIQNMNFISLKNIF